MKTTVTTDGDMVTVTHSDDDGITIAGATFIGHESAKWAQRYAEWNRAKSQIQNPESTLSNVPTRRLARLIRDAELCVGENSDTVRVLREEWFRRRIERAAKPKQPARRQPKPADDPADVGKPI